MVNISERLSKKRIIIDFRGNRLFDSPLCKKIFFEESVVSERQVTIIILATHSVLCNFLMLVSCAVLGFLLECMSIIFFFF